MNEEMLEILTEQGERTGLFKKREIIHRTGEWHFSVHVWLIEGDNVLLQKRAETKESWPGRFDATAAGHVSAGETCAQAAVRETLEEVGVALSEQQLCFAGVQRLCIKDEGRNFHSNEFNYVFLAEIDREQCLFKVDTTEISSIHWVPFTKVCADLESGDKRYGVDLNEMKMLGRSIKNA